MLSAITKRIAIEHNQLTCGTWSNGSRNLHQFSTVSGISGGCRVETWKARLDFQLLRDLRLRATRSRDMREATFSERFDNSPGGGSVFDPARNHAQSTITLLNAGNPELRPEVADATVVGLVYQPRWAEGLRMSIDRYEVDIADSIATLGAQRVVEECHFNNVLCEYVFRDDLGALSRVQRGQAGLPGPSGQRYAVIQRGRLVRAGAGALHRRSAVGFNVEL
jgi:outer membrane receptor protein involved in Fe transport